MDCGKTEYQNRWHILNNIRGHWHPNQPVPGISKVCLLPTFSCFKFVMSVPTARAPLIFLWPGYKDETKVFVASPSSPCLCDVRSTMQQKAGHLMYSPLYPARS